MDARLGWVLVADFGATNQSQRNQIWCEIEERKGSKLWWGGGSSCKQCESTRTLKSSSKRKGAEMARSMQVVA